MKAILKNKEEKILLLKRSVEKYPEVKNPWDIIGGRINPGTALLENLKREIKEEVGLELKTEPKLIAAQDILRVPGRHVVRLTYMAEIEGTPVLNEEHSEYGWFSLEELKQKEGMDEFVKDII